jgi:hypothetical protein
LWAFIDPEASTDPDTPEIFLPCITHLSSTPAFGSTLQRLTWILPVRSTDAEALSFGIDSSL